MKIIKKNTKINEAELNADSSVKELANDFSEVTNGELDGKEAKAVAAETKEIADTLGADTEIAVGKQLVISDGNGGVRAIKTYDVENRITRKLDQALEENLDHKRKGEPEVENLLITGLPGSGKTASVYDWANRSKSAVLEQFWAKYAKKMHIDLEKMSDKERAEFTRVHITYVNAKNNDLDAFINGYTVQDPDNKLTVRQAVSNNLAGLDRPNSVLFLDEYNRQTKDQVRASLLTLINEHYVTGLEEGGRHYFNNFLFTVACCNPGGGVDDRGAVELNQAEQTRFSLELDDSDSDPEATSEFVTKECVSNANDIIAAAGNEALDDIDLEDIEVYLKIADLCSFITHDGDFKYDDRKDNDQLSVKKRKLFNQRLFTSRLSAAKGDPEKFRTWVNEDSRFLDTTKTMLNDILDAYEDQGIPTFEELLNHYNIKLNQATLDKLGNANTAAAPSAEQAPEPEIEDHDDIFEEQPEVPNVQSANDVKNTLDSVVGNWLKG